METNQPLSQLISLEDKTAIVTGGAVGIGFGIANRLAEAGANVMIADVNAQQAQKSASDLAGKGYSVESVAVDVSQEADIKRMIDETLTAFHSVDILVNNAGIYPTIPISTMTFADFEKVLHINLISVFMATKYAAEVMIKQGNGGKIINVTSIDALHPSMIGLAHYDASKHGVWGFTKNSALEYAPHKIWINAIAPGGIATPGTGMVQNQDSETKPAMDPKIIESFLAKIPMHRMGEPDDIGKVALFLASDMASYMTGSQIVVDGGVLLS